MQDSQLLEDFVTRNSETAFQSLVDRYLNLVHSTALRHVRNAALAEEVAQAVFILLARKAVRLRRTRNLVLGGWLYRTTRFVAARAVRGELRRQQRDRRLFDMQQLTSADETWRRIAPLLDEGIEQLAQTDRDAVILRFFQDEPLQKVGSVLGISEEAARKRVSRSLEKLRAFFVRRGFTLSTGVLATALAGHRADAAPANLAGAIGAKALAHAASATAALPVLVAETLQMWRWAAARILVGIATVAAVAIVAVFMTARASTSLPRHDAASPATLMVSNTTPAPVPGVMATTTPPSNTWHFSFQAVDAETGKGIANARILVESVGDMKQVVASPQQIDRQTNLQTDAEGRCNIELPYANPLMVSVGVVADGYEERSVVGGEPKPLPNSYVLKVPRGSRIGGVVQDEAGQPVAGAGIQISFYDTGDSSDREFQRERPGLLNEDSVATTDSEGRWTFASAPTNGDFRIAVLHPGFPPASFRNDDDARSSPDATALKLNDLHAGTAVLVVNGGLTLRGVITDENGYHVAGATVSPGRFFPENHGVAADSDGSFVLAALPPGQNFITVTADGFAPQRLEVEMSSNSAPLTVQLKPGMVLRLRVLDDSGVPVSNARVGVDRWQGPNTLGWGGLTDSEGRIVWKSAPLEPITLSVVKDGYFYSRDNNLTANGQEHAIRLHPQLIVSGRVTDAETKQPITAFKAIPGSDRSDTAYGTNGQFELKLMELSHPLVVGIEAEGYEPASSEPLAPGAAQVTCNFELKRRAPEEGIEGVVLLPDGRAAAGAEVGLRNTAFGVAVGRGRLMKTEDSAFTRTGADGHFFFAAGRAASAVVAVNQEGIGVVSLTRTNGWVSIQLQPWGRIKGVLRLKTQPIASQQIALFNPPKQNITLDYGAYSTKTDAQGNFAFDQAPPGSFNLYVANLNEPYSHQTPVQIQPGATTVAQIGGTGGIVAGRLVFSNPGQTINWSKRLVTPMLQTKLPYPAGISGRARADWYQQYSNSEEGRTRIAAVCSYPLVVQADGAFSVEGVPLGDYELSGQLSDATVDLSMGVFGHTIGSFRQDVAVPQPADGQAGEKIDLGVIPVQSQNP